MSRPLTIATTGLLALATLIGLTATEAQAAAVPPLNAKVLNYAKSHLGKQVGDGECWALANEALRAAGAHQPGRAGYPAYVFGKQVSLNAIVPGDVLQFEQVRFAHRYPDGRSYSSDFPHHTAIVYSVRGHEITLIQQNSNGVRKVTTGTINLDHRSPGGALKAFRPQPR